jgi:hypothetical protein
MRYGIMNPPKRTRPMGLCEELRRKVLLNTRLAKVLKHEGNCLGYKILMTQAHADNNFACGMELFLAQQVQEDARKARK